MKIYIATPVNARKEDTLKRKREKASDRVGELIGIIEDYYKDNYPDIEIECHSSFDIDIAPLGIEGLDEATIMGRCVQRVMECDAIFLDDDFMKSRGCKLERDAALHYDKYFLFSDDMDIQKRKERFGY